MADVIDISSRWGSGRVAFSKQAVSTVLTRALWIGQHMQGKKVGDPIGDNMYEDIMSLLTLIEYYPPADKEDEELDKPFLNHLEKMEQAQGTRELPSDWRSWRIATLRRWIIDNGLSMPYMWESTKREVHEWMERYVESELTT